MQFYDESIIQCESCYNYYTPDEIIICRICHINVCIYCVNNNSFEDYCDACFNDVQEEIKKNNGDIINFNPYKDS